MYIMHIMGVARLNWIASVYNAYYGGGARLNWIASVYNAYYGGLLG